MNWTYGVNPGVRDAADGNVFVAEGGVVSREGPGPSPWSPSWHAGHFGI